MPLNQSKKLIVCQRRQKVSDLYLQGHTQHAIATELGVPQSTVCRDLQAIKKQWRESTIRNFEEQVQHELRKIDLVEREAWDTFERSKKPAQEATARDGDPARGTKRVRSRHGDTKCLDTIMRCIAARRELLGLDPHKPQIAIQADNLQISDQSELRRQLLGDPKYLEFLRDQAVDADSGTPRLEGESRIPVP